MRELIERLETGQPRYETDRLITERTGYPNLYRREDGTIPENSTFPCFTTSVDAAIALQEQCLPGWRLCFDAVDGVANDLYLLGPNYRDDQPEQNSSPPIAGKPIALAICLAVLMAKESEK